MSKLKSTIKGVERAKILKDLETAKELEVQDLLAKLAHKQDPKQSNPVNRSDLPKE